MDRDDEYVCEICETTFESATDLETHINEIGLVD